MICLSVCELILCNCDLFFQSVNWFFIIANFSWGFCLVFFLMWQLIPVSRNCVCIWNDRLWSSHLTECWRLVDCWSVFSCWTRYQTNSLKSVSNHLTETIEFSNLALKTSPDVHFILKNKTCILFLASFPFCLVVTQYGGVMLLKPFYDSRMLGTSGTHLVQPLARSSL